MLWYCLKNSVMSTISRAPRAGPSGLQDDVALGGVFRLVRVARPFFAVDVHRVGAANTFTRQGSGGTVWVHSLELDECVQQHAFCAIQFELNGLYVGLRVLVGS